MKFLVDAQLPRRLAYRLRDANHDALHTLDLPLRNRTEDEEINERSIDESRIVITKDTDFVSSFMLTGEPRKLSLVSTGNIVNADLEDILPQIPVIAAAFETYDYLELTRTNLIFHS